MTSSTDDDTQVEDSTGRRRRFDDLGNAQLLVVCGLGLTALGSVLPWFADADRVVLGVEDGGLLTLPVVSVLAALLAFSGWTKKTGIVSLTGGTLVGFVAFFSLTGTSVFGVYLTLVGGTAIAVGSLLLPELGS